MERGSRLEAAQIEPEYLMGGGEKVEQPRRVIIIHNPMVWVNGQFRSELEGPPRIRKVRIFDF